MAQTDVFALGFSGGGPTPSEVDSLSSRLAQAQGIRTGTQQQAIGYIDGLLLPVQATALQASDAIQGTIDSTLEPARDVQLGTYQAALQAIEMILAPLRADAAKNLPAPPKRRRKPKGAPPGGPAVAQTIPPTAPPGCRWYQYPPGQSGPPRLICPLPVSPPVPVQQPPLPGGQPPSPTPQPPIGPPGAQGGLAMYWIILDCAANEAVAVPCATPDQQAQLMGEGWCPLEGVAQWQLFGSAADALAWLQSNQDHWQALCPLYLDNCPNAALPLPVGPGYPPC